MSSKTQFYVLCLLSFVFTFALRHSLVEVWKVFDEHLINRFEAIIATFYKRRGSTWIFCIVFRINVILHVTTVFRKREKIASSPSLYACLIKSVNNLKQNCTRFVSVPHLRFLFIDCDFRFIPNLFSLYFVHQTVSQSGRTNIFTVIMKSNPTYCHSYFIPQIVLAFGSSNVFGGRDRSIASFEKICHNLSVFVCFCYCGEITLEHNIETHIWRLCFRHFL